MARAVKKGPAKRSKAKTTLEPKSTTVIPVASLRPGDQLARRIEETSDGEIVALASIPVKTVDECPGMWRTHIHVNRDQCYDGRQWVTVIA